MMWLMLQQETPDDFVVATGEMHSVREFCVKAFAVTFSAPEQKGGTVTVVCFEVIGKTLTWAGKGIQETGTDQEGIVRVRIDERYFRPTEVEQLLGDATKAKEKLGWVPPTTFEQLVREMVLADIEALN